MTADRPNDALMSSLGSQKLPDATESMRLVTEAKAGNREALNELLRRYESRLRRIVRIRLNAKLRRCVESVDIVQETYRSAFSKIGSLELRSTASILQWLARIAENQMIDTHRHFYGGKRDKTREVTLKEPERGSSSQDAETPGVSPPGTALPPDEIASQRELAAIVDECVAELPDDYREVVMLRTYLGGSWEYVTQELGRPNAEATRQLHRRARIRLSRIVRQRMGEPEG